MSKPMRKFLEELAVLMDKHHAELEVSCSYYSGETVVEGIEVFVAGSFRKAGQDSENFKLLKSCFNCETIRRELDNE